ncbi:hypothetical protein VspSTUT16_47490 [Vibrio sp. STUT-A16]|nr:hypothetical protein VspSTUT16_47490 [Vibrio sp. STUT-A16]
MVRQMLSRFSLENYHHTTLSSYNPYGRVFHLKLSPEALPLRAEVATNVDYF